MALMKKTLKMRRKKKLKRKKSRKQKWKLLLGIDIKDSIQNKLLLKRRAVMMIPKKKKVLYEKIKYGERRRKRQAEVLANKRKAIDEEKRLAV